MFRSQTFSVKIFSECRSKLTESLIVVLEPDTDLTESGGNNAQCCVFEEGDRSPGHAAPRETGEPLCAECHQNCGIIDAVSDPAIERQRSLVEKKRASTDHEEIVGRAKAKMLQWMDADPGLL
jgi:hypothetical protein